MMDRPKQANVMGYVFDTEGDAITALSQAETEMKIIIQERGIHTVIEGKIVGHDSDGNDALDSNRWEHWCKPKQLIDGRWSLRSWRQTFVTTFERVEQAITPSWTFEDLSGQLPTVEVP